MANVRRLVACGIAMLAARSHAQSITTDPQFHLQRHWGQMGWTVALRFAANCPDVFAAEKSGPIRWYASIDAEETDYKLLTTLPAHQYMDRGLLGLAIHPEFPAQPYVFAMYTYGAPVPSLSTAAPQHVYDTCPVNPFIDPNGVSRCHTVQRLVRLQIDVAKKSLVAIDTLIEGWCIVGRSHAVGDLTFTASGNLLASAGDGSTYESGADAGVDGDGCFDRSGPKLQGAFRSQSDLYLNGKIIRIRAAALLQKLAPGKKLVKGQDYKIVAKGLRNPYRMATQPKTGDLFIGDVGASAVEEIDRLANPDKSSGVTNFAWPCNEGSASSAEYARTPEYVAFCKQQTGLVDPFFEYTHTNPNLTSLCSGSSASPTGIAFYPAAKANFPAFFSDVMFWLEGSKRCVLYFENDPATGLPDTKRLHTFVYTLPGATPKAERPGQFVDIQFDKAGRMFLVDVFESAVFRVEFVGPAKPAKPAKAAKA